MQHINIYGIIGQPLGHSLSPSLHNWAFEQCGHQGIFNAWPLKQEQLSDFVTAMRTLRIGGACVTIPYKEKIIPLLDGISKRAQSIGAVNTIFWKDDALWGENTDVDGFKFPLTHGKNSFALQSALVLGAGGAARAVIVGLKELAVEHIYVSNHNIEKASTLAKEFEIKTVPWEDRMSCHAQSIVNTTPLGMHGSNEHLNPYDFTMQKSTSNGHCLAYDLVYNPLQTVFLRQALQMGFKVQDGLDMFVGQALSQMKLWYGSSTEASQTRDFITKNYL